MAEIATLPDPTACREIRRLVDEYCATQRHPSLPSFVVHGPFNRESAREIEASRGPGCYAIYGADGFLRYIGMSLAAVGTRSETHFSKATQLAPFWQRGSPARFVDVIEVRERWDAPSLEEYLNTKTGNLRN